MNLKLLIVLTVLLFAGNCWAASCTSVKTGNWASFDTWSSATCTNADKHVPGTGTFANYSAVVATTHTVTLSDDRTLYATVVEGSLTQGNSFVTTLTGNLTIGNGAGKDGTFTFGAGSTIAQQGFSIVQNNCRILSNATSGAWATVTGTGTWSKGTAYTAPKMEISPRYVSFQTTGAILFPQGQAASGGAGVTYKTDIQYCAFVGTGAITHGVAGWTPPTVPTQINHNDFRDLTGHIIFYDQGTDPGATVHEFRYNTFSQATTGMTLALPWGFDTTGSVFDNFYPINANSGKKINFTKSFFQHRSAASGSTMLSLYNTPTIASTLTDSYLYGAAAQANSHGVNMGSSAAKVTVQNNVFEFLGTEPNIVNYTANTNLDLIGNLVIGDTTNSLLTAGSASTTGAVLIKQNTQVSKYGAAFGLFLSENNPTFTTPLTISSNLIQKTSIDAPFTAINNNAANTLNIASVINNASIAADSAAAYGNVDAITTDSGNLYGVDAQFVDATRNLTTWGATVGSDGTVAGTVAKLLLINGYNATTKIQSDTPSGVSIAGTATSLVDWVRAGFTPQNPALKGTGEGGVDIGAVAVQVQASTPALRGFGFRFNRGFGF